MVWFPVKHSPLHNKYIYEENILKGLRESQRKDLKNTLGRESNRREENFKAKKIVTKKNRK